MVEELKLAVKVDDDIIEQSLLKQFNNAEKLADKVVFTFKNVNLDNKEIEKQFKDMQKLAGKNPIELPIDTDKSLKMLNALGKEFSKIIDIVKGINNTKISADSSTTSIKEESKAMEKVADNAEKASKGKEKFSKANKKVKDSADSSKKSIKEEDKYLQDLSKNINKYQKDLDSASRKPTDGKRSSVLQEKIDNINDFMNRLKQLQSKMSDSSYVFNPKDIEDGNKLKATIEENIQAIKSMSAAEKGSTESSRLKLYDKISKYLKDNTKLSKQAREELEGYLKLLQSGNPSVNVDELNQKFLRLSGSERMAKREGKSFFSIFKDKALYGYAAQLAQYYLSFYDFIRYARNAINAIRELDTALVDLKKTTAMSSSSLEDFYYNSNDVAKDLGVTTKEIIEQASAWSRLGYNTQKASTEMAKYSAQFAAISPGMDLDVATDGLVSTMKAFDIEVEDVERRIMDNINKIGNTAATENTELVDMLTRSSAAMAVANNTLEETIALETAAVEITRSAETTGTAFKTISMRIRGYDEETEELSEDLKNISGDIADLTKTASTPGGISLFTDESKTTYKSTYQILKEISEIYDELTDKNRADLLEKLAGKRGGQVIGSLLLNFKSAEKALQNMENAAGSADAEMSIVQESLDYKINALKETWVGTAQEMIDRGDFGDIVDGLTKLSEAIGWVIDKAGLLGTIGLGAGLFAGIKNFGRPKMFGLCFEIAEYHKCSLGY